MGVRNRIDTILVKNLTDFDKIFIHHILLLFFSNYILLNASFVRCIYLEDIARDYRIKTILQTFKTFRMMEKKICMI